MIRKVLPVLAGMLLWIIGSTKLVAQTSAGTAFTYQGQLKLAGEPVTDTADFEFSLWDADVAGNQIGTLFPVDNHGLEDGLFTVVLDFGQDIFTGEARWLEIAVRSPAGGGDFATLSPRQKLTPVPFALALPGLWTQQNATSPNLIGGYSGNSVTAGVEGATIGGGGKSGNTNHIVADYGTIGGGWGNEASDMSATVGGGKANTASGSLATVGGGATNTASGEIATVGGGFDNSASGEHATVGGGHNNAATNVAATVGGGVTNAATGFFSFVGGGSYNVTSSLGATIAGGYDNTASGESATVPGGRGNTATGDYSFAAGRRAKANHPGAFVWADSTDADFASTADNQFLIRASGGVGIGTTTPNAKLEVAGIPGTDGIMFPDGTLQTSAAAGGVQYTNLGIGSFAAMMSADIVQHPTAGVFGLDPNAALVAPIDLPHGATILEVTAYTYDVVATDLQFYLYRNLPESLIGENIVSFRVQGSAGFQSASVSPNHVVDNQTGQYFLVITTVSGSWPGNSNLAVQFVRIKWQP